MRILKWILKIIAIVLSIVLIIALLIQIPSVQNELVHFAASELEKSIGAEVSVGNVSIDFLSHIQINQVLIRDYKQDTMIYASNIDNHHSIIWEWTPKIFDQKLTINGAKVYLDNTRADSVFNITHTFAKNKKKKVATPPSSIQSPKKDKLRFLSFGEIELNDASFRLKDLYNYQTLSIHVKDLDIKAHKLDIDHQIKLIDEIKIDRPNVSLVHHTMPYRPKDYEPQYISFPFDVDVCRLKLIDAKFTIFDEEDGPKATKGFLSFMNLNVKDIHLNATDVKLRKREFKGKVNHFEAKEKSGLAITDIKTDFSLNSYKTEAKNLHFKTNFSEVNGYLRFDYKHMKQYLRFAEWVRVTADVSNSNMSIKDLGYFAPSLVPWKHLDIKFNTKASGRMNDLNLTQLVASLNHNHLKANGKMRVMDLFNGKGLHTIADLTNTSFDKADAGFVFNYLKMPDEMDRIGRINYKGQFVGNPVHFTLNGEANSVKGKAHLSQAQFDFSNKSSPTYKGNVKLVGLKLGEIISNDNPINSISADLKIDGRGYDLMSVNSYIKGNIQQLEFNHSQYQNIDVDGDFKNRIFEGKIKSKDPTLHFDADGKIAMQSKTPDIELNIGLDNVDLKKLGYTKKKLLMNAKIFAIGHGRNIDEMLGTMSFKDMYLIDVNHGNKRYDFSTLTVEKDEFEEGDKYIDINSEEIQASLVGKFKISDLPQLMKEYMISYLAIDAKRENQSYSNTYFNLNASLKNVKSYSRLIYDEIKNIERGDINMRFDGVNNKLKLKANLFNMSINQFDIPIVKISNESSNHNFIATLDFDSVYFQNKLAITPLKAELSQVSQGLKLSVELLKREDEKFVDFNSIIQKKGDLYSINVLPFNSYFGRKVWALNPDNRVVINSNSKEIIISDLELFKDRQEIKVSSQDGGKTIEGLFENVRIEELISGFLPNLKSIKGSLSGKLDLVNIWEKPTPIANLDVKSITFDEDKIGDLNIKSTYNEGVLFSKLNLIGPKANIQSEGIYTSKFGVDSISTRSKIDYVQVDFLSKFLGDLVYDLKGVVHGDVDIQGRFDGLEANGELIIDSLQSGITSLHTKYISRNQPITLVSNKFVFNDFEFNDEEGHSGKAFGFISHDHLKSYSLYLDAESPELLCLNTNSSHNPNFYGKVYADANIQFRGIIGERISISAKGKNLANSNLTIAFGSNQRTEKYSFYNFMKKGDITNNLAVRSKNKSSGVNLDFDFDVNNLGKLQIIMDPSLDDRIECTGTGKIAFGMTPETDMDIKGFYEITSGTYLFTYQNLVQRLFYINRGGRMTFVGNPYASIIDATAKFTTRASASDLITAYFGNTTDQTLLSASKSNIKVNILLHLKDKMLQPNLRYELDIEQNNPAIQSATEAIMTTTKNNESELNKQVLGLMVFQKFFPPTNNVVNNSTASALTSSDAINTVGDAVTSKLSGYMTEWLQNTFRGMNVDFNYKSYSQFNKVSNINDARNELKFAVSQKLLNDRLIFNLGGNYDFGKNQFSTGNSSYFGGDLDIEYLFSKSGNVRGKIYSTLNNDPLNSSYINKTGVGILYQKEFDKVKSIFKK